jgi:hypothetical protein
MLVEELRLDGFRAGLETCVLQPGAIEQVHLSDPDHVEQREQILQFDARAGFFDCLAYRALGRGLAQFHETCRQRPQAVSRLDVATAQQHLLAPDRHRAHHVEGVLVVHLAAGGADRAVTVVVGRHAVLGRRAADAAMLDAAHVEHALQFSRLAHMASSPGPPQGASAAASKDLQ